VDIASENNVNIKSPKENIQEDRLICNGH